MKPELFSLARPTSIGLHHATVAISYRAPNGFVDHVVGAGYGVDLAQAVEHAHESAATAYEYTRPRWEGMPAEEQRDFRRSFGLFLSDFEKRRKRWRTFLGFLRAVHDVASWQSWAETWIPLGPMLEDEEEEGAS